MTDILATARRVGLLGGTFDPVHYGHLLMAEEACQQFSLDIVAFIPNGLPAHKQGEQVSSPEDRASMVGTAISGNERFVCSRVELDRPGLSYSIDTIAAFRAQYRQLDALYFITGADAILELPTWHRASELTSFCDFIATTRPGADLSRLNETIGSALAAHVHFMPIPGIDISSTGLRRRVAEGHTIRYQTPDAVIDYIRRMGLYGSS